MSNSTPAPVFSFQSQQVRTIIEDGQPWFVAKDVCQALGILWNGKLLSGIPEGWQSMRKLLTLRRGTQNIRLISEPAVYKLAFRSNKPQADAFTNWVASEVLPAVRTTGKYEANPKQKALPQQKALPPAPKQKALPPSHSEVDALLGKVRFYIREIAEAEKRITDIVDENTLPALKPFPGRESPAWKYIVNAGCSTRSLWTSIDFALKAVEDSIKLRLEVGA